jgi:hypothetical protein
MFLSPITAVFAISLTVAAVFVAALVVARAWLAKRHQLACMTRGRQAEAAARALLIRRGYEIEGVQVRRRCFVLCDSRALVYDVIADLVVRRDGKRFVADAKTGACANILDRSTRRQLIEYALVFECDGVLLVNPIRGTVEEVEFPFLDPARR